MSTQTLSRVTLETLANVRTAASRMMAAYGAGSRRLVQAVDGALTRQVLPVTARLAPAAGRRLEALRGAMSRTAEQGIDAAVARSERAIAAGSHFAVTQIERWADRAVDIDNALIAQGLDTAARLSLPAAQLARAVSLKVAEGTSALGGPTTQETVARPARKARKAGPRRAKATVADAPRAGLQTSTKTPRAARPRRASA